MRLHERDALVRPVSLIPQQTNNAGNVLRVVRQRQSRQSGESFAGPGDDVVFAQFLDHPLLILGCDEQLAGSIKEFTPSFGVEADVLVLGDELQESSLVKLRAFWRFRHHGLTKAALTGTPTELDQATTADKVLP
ncbi:hypothetical protein SK854_31375 [Lentzea sp. BCCO 10_0061]|uniref:Uncharacterized protein n=1 Tax=Lentzea sokolovensis TaxID=3095429 RepID=A0ABU4V4E4_9PSEU|nr:hypothetical protein [Lentzea sp. BCCO 10_0061]MDX8146652.1 hypothetical protein [Lentzea sp. BCCO 10_0061]